MVWFKHWITLEVVNREDSVLSRILQSKGWKTLMSSEKFGTYKNMKCHWRLTREEKKRFES